MRFSLAGLYYDVSSLVSHYLFQANSMNQSLFRYYNSNLRSKCSPYKDLFRILTASKLERGQKLDEFAPPPPDWSREI